MSRYIILIAVLLTFFALILFTFDENNDLIKIGSSSSTPIEKVHHQQEKSHRKINHHKNKFTLLQSRIEERMSRHTSLSNKNKKPSYSFASSIVPGEGQYQKPIPPPDPSQCKTCRFIILNLVNSASTNASQQQVRTELNKHCETRFSDNKFNSEVCKSAVTFLDNLLPGGMYVLDTTYGFDMGAIFCADILELCIEPCCNTTSPFQPEQLRLGFANSQGSGSLVNMTVSWLTYKPTTGDRIEYFYSSDGNHNIAKKKGNVHSSNPSSCKVTTEDVYDFGGMRGVIHGCQMWNLRENSIIQYRVGSDLGFSSWRTFRTLPKNIGNRKEGGRPLRIAVVADIGIFNSSNTIRRIYERVLANQIDAFLIVGDQGYFDGDENQWNIWQRMSEPIVSRIPLITAVGNHEIPNFFATYKFRYSQFNPPAGNGAPSDAMYYFLNIGNVNMFLLNTETPLNEANIDAVQRDWLKPLMQQVSQQPGTFLWMNHHRPLYCSSGASDCLHWSQVLRDQVEDLYHSNGVDLIQSGHVHNYERSFPVFQNKVVSTNYNKPNAATQIVFGNPGNREPMPEFERENKWSAFRYREDFLYQIYEFYQVEDEEKEGVYHSFLNATTFRSATNEIIDKFTLISKR